jgi:2-polyprenyl-6-methoxyphenol hydroxylase-like FAD-dependent oxidoreductase
LNDNDILIIGGGIGGLATALALRQRGIAARVYEAAPDIHAAGAGIIIAPNGMRVLQALGLADAVQARGVALDGLELTDASRKPLLNTSSRAEFVRDFGFGLTGILRASLYQLLLDAVPAGAIVTGKSLTRFDDDGSSVTADFADGSRARGRLLIAADGIGSAARKQLFPQIQPRFSGQTSYRGVADFALPERADGLLACEAWGARMRMGVVAVSSCETYWYTTYPASAEGRDTSKEAALTAVLAAATDLAPPFADVLRATRPSRVLRTDIADLPPLPAWYRGRVALLGDAAHATTPNLGQGGNQALVDAVALADALVKYTDHSAAFAAYQAARKTRAEMIVSRSRQLGALVHVRSGVVRGLRNALLRLTPASVRHRQNREIFGGARA